MLLAFDTYYYDDKAKTVCLAFERWTDAEPLQIYTKITEGVAPYVPGSFYKRELPCIIDLLKEIPLTHVEAIIVDGFVFLDDAMSLGLGGHLYEYLNKQTPVIGVAKTNFAAIHQLKREVKRGQSKNALYVTAIGVDLDRAIRNVESLHGEFRIPTLLKKLDSLTKEK